MKFPKKLKVAIILGAIVAVAGVIALGVWFMSTHNLAILNPKGTIAAQQKQLIVVATLLMAVVVLPVFALTFGIAWRYRESNTKATYSPDLSGNTWAEATWWLIPLAIIAVLAGIVVATSHSLDPYKPIAQTTSSKPPIRVQVVSMEWKWLFLYPDLHVATVNQLYVPVDTPIAFTLTSDAPMNSFWVPQLGGQVYTMSGMSTQLHLMADTAGDYYGSSANISGEGFADMKFMVHATSQDDFTNWAQTTAASEHQFTLGSYNELAKPSTKVAPASYALPDAANGLYDTVLLKYGHHH